MAKFVLSAFSDEIDAALDGQISALKRLDINGMELRGVDGQNFTLLDDGQIAALKQKLRENGIFLSALGSPLGKFNVGDDIGPHLKLADRVMDIGEELGCNRIRMFSFYPAEGMSAQQFENAAFDYTSQLLEKADRRGFVLCHENEKDIYGESPAKELKLLSHFGGALRAVLDPGNFAFCGIDGRDAFDMLKPYIEYFHIKDCDKPGCIVPPGDGKGYIKENLEKANSAFDGEFILTMEPHLCVFTGLSGLSKLDDIKHEHTYESPFAAFSLAVSRTRDMLSSL